MTLDYGLGALRPHRLSGLCADTPRAVLRSGPHDHQWLDPDRALLRHRLQQEGEKPLFKSGPLAVDLVRRLVTVNDREIKLTPREYDLLRLLVSHAGKVLTHKFLLGELWDDLTDAQYLRVYVRQLRQKIEADPERPQYILTETGIGYRLRAPD